MKITGPLFKWFGSKWLSSKTLPPPNFPDIVEPFAGSAGYSLRHCYHKVILYESNDYVRELWKWLVRDATQAAILDIPINVLEGTDLRTIGLSRGQLLLLKHWQRTNNVGDCWTVSPWGNKPGQWTESTRSRVSEEFGCIEHWHIANSWNGMDAFGQQQVWPATWFIDPPYQYNYQYKSAPLNYRQLALEAERCLGQVIVCEAVCQKTNRIPDYLPFEFWAKRITSRRKEGDNTHSRELIWHKQ